MTSCSMLWLVMKGGITIFTQKWNKNSIEWHLISQKKEKAITVPSLGWAVFWDAEECILIDFLPKGEIIKMVKLKSLKKLPCALHKKHPMKMTVILQHENAQTSHRISDMRHNCKERLESDPTSTKESIHTWSPQATTNSGSWKIMTDLHYKNDNTVQDAMPS